MATLTNSPKLDLGSLHIPERQRRNTRTVKRVILAATPILLLAGVVVLACTFRLRKPVVDVATVATPNPAAGQTLLNASGYVTPRRRATIAAKIIGQAQQSVANCTISAPFDGIVVSQDAQVGEMVSPVSAGGGFTRTGIATIVDMNSNEIEVDVNESYIARIGAVVFQVSREIDYYAKQARSMTMLITVLGGLVAGVMAIGAIFGALNPMYSAVSERSREIATMRALGFGGPSVVTSFLIEALLVSFIGGVLGCIAVLPLNGLTTGAMNWQTFSHLAFAFRITPALLVGGIFFALFMGILEGLPPAIRAARRPIALALREL